MTTDSKPGPRSGLSPLVGAVGAGAVAVLVLVVVAALTDGRPAVVGAAAGGVLTLVVFASGIVVVGLVARLMPAASPSQCTEIDASVAGSRHCPR